MKFFLNLDDQGRIGLEKAQEIVLSQLGIADAVFSEKGYELDDDVYELEFAVNGVEYEYEVDAVTGKVQEADREHNDDWDDLDYDDLEDGQDDDHDGRNDEGDYGDQDDDRNDDDDQDDQDDDQNDDDDHDDQDDDQNDND